MAIDKSENFELIQRQAKALASSNMIPKAYQGNVANCLLAMEIADRLRMSTMDVMQNLDVIMGKPRWSSRFQVAAMNSSGLFEGLVKYEIIGEGMEMKCRCWAIEKDTGERLEGPWCSMKMAKEEGWLGKSGSKWKTMPDLMIRYRAATFFGALYCSQSTQGIRTEDELNDISASNGHQRREISIGEDPPEIIDLGNAAELPEDQDNVPEVVQEVDTSQQQEDFTAFSAEWAQKNWNDCREKFFELKAVKPDFNIEQSIMAADESCGIKQFSGLNNRMDIAIQVLYDMTKA